MKVKKKMNDAVVRHRIARARALERGMKTSKTQSSRIVLVSGRPIHAGAALFDRALLLLMAGCARRSSVRARDPLLAPRQRASARPKPESRAGTASLQRTSRRFGRNFRHGAAHRRASHSSVRNLGRGDQSRQRKTSRRSHHRSRTLRRRHASSIFRSPPREHRHGRTGDRARPPESDRRRARSTVSRCAAARERRIMQSRPAPSPLAIAPNLFATLSARNSPTREWWKEQRFWRVLVGHGLTFDDANQLAAKVRDDGDASARRQGTVTSTPIRG